MAVTIHVNGKSNSLAHKGSMGIAKSTLPDVCKTPSPGGPIPVPYPVIVSMSSDLKKGTKTVKVDGKNPAAVKGSEFSRCTGDEAGTAGGIKSSTNMKEATWLLYSFDVKLDGKNACRLSDKMMMNHGNTACLGGELQLPIAQVEEILQNICCACEEEEKPGPYEDCATLGEKKHRCCEEKLTFVKGVGGERGYKRDGTPFTNGPRAQMPGEPYWTFRRRIARAIFPDACALDTSGNPAKLYDFKFGCEKDVPCKMKRIGAPTSRKDGTPILAGGVSKPMLEGKQLKKYRRLSEKLDIDEEPGTISNRDC